MAILPIVKYPAPGLKEVCEPVTEFNSTLHRQLDDMFETMYEADGIGLAAPQVGIQRSFAVIDISGKGQQKIELINPEIVEESGQTDSEEGCLSIPGFRETISRSTDVVVNAFDRHGQPFEIRADDLLAICLQHEIDHLNGILFVDYMSRLKRDIFKSWLKKNLPFKD